MDSVDYEVVDADKDVLRGQLIKLDDEISQSLSGDRKVPQSSVEAGISEIYTAISKKYNLDIEYRDFRDFITNVANEDRLTKAINEALGSKVITSLAQRTQLKLIISMSYLIDRSLELIERQANTINTLTPELVAMIDRCLQWFTTLQEMKNSVSSYDADKDIVRAIDNDKRENPEKYSNEDSQSKDESSINISVIHEIMNNLKKTK